MIPVIICGGFGTKLWPISRESKPKHFLKLIGDKSLFELNYEALRTKFKPEEIYVKMIGDCASLARRENKYITCGFRPDYPVMGVDYLIKGERVSGENNVGIYKVDKFVWRGSKEQTEDFIKQDNALVHANHTCMTPRNLLYILQKYKPEWYGPLMNIINGGDLKTEYSNMPPGPIEDVTQQVHAAGESLVVELPFKWVDFGTFESLFKYLKEKGLYQTPENIVEINSPNNFIKLDDSNKVIALIGIDNFIIVDTGDALLICDKDQTGQVGEALKEVKSRKISIT